MERLGRTLGEIVKEHGLIPESTAARLGVELIGPIQYMHSKNILYVDIKPDNFMLNLGKENQVYCVDFGICEKFISAVTGKHKQQVFGAVYGTPTFVGLNCHLGSNASRRDDIEALLYVLIYMIHGSLPWENAKTNEEGAMIKQIVTVEQLCEGLNPSWATMLQTARGYTFEAKPKYEWFSAQFTALAGTYAEQEPFQWK